ncbi:nucleic acid/nucleotide deaminase domain-containing protein [Streptomyces californicus]|uniref:nucleic acid/nucleotide deaminase domain-containing protein n=1 Tax=Streptomyces californicus TaxID=67351 RepID=UPI0036DD8855
MARRGKWPAGSAEDEGHAEDHILEQLAVKYFSPKRISALYTERQLCPVCGPNLENLLKEGTEITWSVQWGRTVHKSCIRGAIGRPVTEAGAPLACSLIRRHRAY